jgi:hypothetical protein
MRSFYHNKPKTIRRLLRHFFENEINWKDWFYLKVCDRKGNMAKENYNKEEIKEFAILLTNELKEKNNPFSIKDLDINGYDIMNFLGISTGRKQVGELLNFIFEKVLENPELNEKEKILKLLKEEKNVLNKKTIS